MLVNITYRTYSVVNGFYTELASIPQGPIRYQGFNTTGKTYIFSPNKGRNLIIKIFMAEFGCILHMICLKV